MVLFYSIFLIIVAYSGAQDAVNEIAFSVGLSHGQTLAINQTVVYDRVFINVGSAYSTTTGAFTCPRNGVYVFQYHGVSKQDKEIYLELYVDDQYQNSAYGHSKNDYATAGNSAILTLSRGNVVVLRAGQAQVDLYGDTLEVYSTFSGFLISSS